MQFGPPLCLMFLAFLGTSLFSSNEALVNLIILNAFVQVILFIAVACIPFLRTGRMSYVDIAWPFGVALIGLQIIVFGEGDLVRRLVAGCVYLFIGLRMGLGAVVMARTTGVIFKTEFPRYVYTRMKMEQAGTKHVDRHILAEIMAQGFANTSVLAFPGLLLAFNASPTISNLEIIGVSMWAAAYCMESAADLQKLKFIANNKGGVCNVGLWRYSRHPNYFAEWLVWTGLVVAAIPSWLSVNQSEPLGVWIALGLGSLGASVMMYITLVYLTGATPAEYYSVRKRPEYRAYQERTNMFFPWFPKN